MFDEEVMHLCSLIRCPRNDLDNSLVILKTNGDGDDETRWIRIVDSKIESVKD